MLLSIILKLTSKIYVISNFLYFCLYYQGMYNFIMVHWFVTLISQQKALFQFPQDNDPREHVAEKEQFVQIFRRLHVEYVVVHPIIQHFDAKNCEFSKGIIQCWRSYTKQTEGVKIVGFSSMSVRFLCILWPK